MSRDNRCGPGDHGEIHDDVREVKEKTNLEGLSRDGCPLSLSRGAGLGSVMDDWVAIR